MLTKATKEKERDGEKKDDLHTDTLTVNVIGFVGHHHGCYLMSSSSSSLSTCSYGVPLYTALANANS